MKPIEIKNKKVFKSMLEFEKYFFPNYHQQQMKQKPEDAHMLGVEWAKETLEKIKNKF
ncbi:MAG: hypothetical protein ABIL68_00540 [bacterium]